MKKLYILLGTIVILSLACTLPPQQKLRKSEIAASDILKQLRKGSSVSYQDKIIIGDLDLTQAVSLEEISTGILKGYLDASLVFTNCTFKGKVLGFHQEPRLIKSISLQRSLTMINCQFEQEVNLRLCEIQGMMQLRDCIFYKKASFEEGSFSHLVSFNHSAFKAEARFQNAFFLRDALFRESIFESTVSFQSSIMNGDLQMSTAQFLDYADFGQLTCQGDVFLSYANIADRMNCNYGSFLGRLEMVNADIMEFQAKKARFWGDVIFDRSEVFRSIDCGGAKYFYSKAAHEEMEIHHPAKVLWE